ncbi:MAG: thioesterase, partial [Oscillospiraceae bacterium]
MDINQELLVTTDSFELPFYDCDYVKRAKISTILKITAQIAGKDYTDRGLGHRFLWDEGYVFLLSRISIHIHRYPVEPEKLVTSTWESGRSGAMFMRGYDV